jgi:hypothetical protein
VGERERKLSADAQLAAPAKGCMVAEEPWSPRTTLGSTRMTTAEY